MGGFELRGIDGVLGGTHPTCRLEPADRFPFCSSD
jgi:hypothetical protein